MALVCGITIFWSAFLLFLIQPLMGKYILPWFGGSPAVWTTCMLFFQILLLCGYSYAHLVARRLSQRTQVILHITLLATSLLTLPLAPKNLWSPEQDPTLPILGLLTVSIGASFLLLSTTGPLLQHWYSRAWPSGSPYRLYAVSNLGSLLALLSYPFVFEPRLNLPRQAAYWSWSYLLFTGLCAVCAWGMFRVQAARALPAEEIAPAVTSAPGGPGPARAVRTLWLMLPACGSLMLLATTNQLCLDVAVVPLLWVVPLVLYLLSFVICFDSDRWYRRQWAVPALIAAIAQSCLVLQGGVQVDMKLQIASYCFTLFAVCMFCHGELAALRPPASQLTSFYWMIAAGGALGGFFVSIAAPRIFGGFWEFQLGLEGAFLLLLVILFRDRRSYFHQGRPRWAWALLGSGFAALLFVLGGHISASIRNSVLITRNFFGVLRIQALDTGDPARSRMAMVHGRIDHGFQYLDPQHAHRPTSYYGPETGIGLALLHHPARYSGGKNLRVGVVGLGTGTLAVYGQPGDTMRFYEINPEVIRLSDRYFTYRKSSKARIEIVAGDARISMERERAQGGSQQYDVLAVDAFTSDAIPIHLLTRECLRIYDYHLKSDGILVLHITNRYFDLHPVVRGLASLDPTGALHAVPVRTPRDPDRGLYATDWVLLTRNGGFLAQEEIRNMNGPWADGEAPLLVWTDDYNNILQLLKRRRPF